MARTLLDILTDRRQNQPDRQAYIFLENGETESGSLTYGELDKQARAIAPYPLQRDKVAFSFDKNLF